MEKANLAEERNALRHQLLAGTVVLPGESTRRFLELIRTMTRQWNPSNETEATQLDRMATARWRQLRIAGLYKSTMQIGMGRQEGPAPNRAIEAMKDQDHPLAALQRDERFYDHQYDRALRMLLRLKDHRHRPGPESEAEGDAELTSSSATWEPDPAPEPEAKTPPEE